MSRLIIPLPFTFSLLVFCLALTPVQTQADQPRTGVAQAVKAAHNQLASAYQQQNSRTRITVKSPDSRLQLNTCAHIPETSALAAPLKWGKVSIKVSCNQPQQWSIYLSATTLQPIVLWNVIQNIQRDAIIRRTDINQSENWLATAPPGAIQNPEMIVGMQARQSIQPNQVIKERYLRQPITIQKGHRLTAAVKQPGFSISTQVIALQDGAKGDTIKVENSKTGKLLFARINPQGRLVIE